MTNSGPRRWLCGLSVVSLVALAAAVPLAAEDFTLEAWPDGGHIRVTEPADLSTDEAEDIYRELQESMIAGYEKSGLHGLDYREWDRLNAHAYGSDQHGARFVNVFANDEAEGALDATHAEPLPPGAKVIKDSISIVESGGVARGPLFLMEKMEDGFDPPNGNWRYTMIMPNGKLFGTTGGQGSASVKFCADCHHLAEDTDFLFKIPAEHLARDE